MARQIALLRGINAGRNRRVDMGELRELCEGLGLSEPRTWVQSGNVVFSSRRAPARVERELESAIATELGVEAKVVVRTRDEMADVIARDPFAGVVDNPKRYQVTFLSAEVDPEVARTVETADIAPEQVVISGREIYAWHPEGIQNSKLARMITDKPLGVTATARNWNTVTKMLALADE